MGGVLAVLFLGGLGGVLVCVIVVLCFSLLGVVPGAGVSFFLFVRFNVRSFLTLSSGFSSLRFRRYFDFPPGC